MHRKWNKRGQGRKKDHIDTKEHLGSKELVRRKQVTKLAIIVVSSGVLFLIVSCIELHGRNNHDLI